MSSRVRPTARATALVAALLVALGVAAAPARAGRLQLTPAGCSGQAIAPTRVITGTFDAAHRGRTSWSPSTSRGARPRYA